MILPVDKGIKTIFKSMSIYKKGYKDVIFYTK